MLENLTKYPILQHYNQNSIVEGSQFKKGQKPILNILRIALIGGFAYLSWVYILPTVFIVLGQLAAGIITAATLITIFLARQPLYNMLKMFARKIAEVAIEQAPFQELERQRGKLEDAKQQLIRSRVNIANLEAQSMKKAEEFVKKTNDLKLQIKKDAEKAKDLQLELENIKKSTPNYQSDDKFNSTNRQFLKVGNQGQRNGLELERSMAFVERYGVNVTIMKNVKNKLYYAELFADNKLADLDLTIEMLHHEYELAAEARKGTTAAKKAMMIDKTWELDYAMTVITNTIANDVSITVKNIKDIDKLASGFDLDSDELFKKLETLSNNIDTEAFKTPSAGRYRNENLVLTEKEKQNSSFKSLFD